jgi:hypothetical protein
MNKYGDEDNTHEEDDQAEWVCPVCSGPVVPMGVLGNRQHGRCRNCGTNVNRKVESGS